MKNDHVQFKLRLPPSLKEALEEVAETNDRTLSGEIVARLESSMGPNIDREMRRVLKATLSIASKFIADEEVLSAVRSVLNVTKDEKPSREAIEEALESFRHLSEVIQATRDSRGIPRDKQ